MNSITKNQIMLIHIAKHQLGIEDDLYRDMLFNLFKVDSSKNLTYKQGKELIEHLKKRGFVIRKKYVKKRKTPDNVIRMASPAQRRLISVLSKRFKWRESNGFRLWLERQQSLGYIKSADMNEFTDADWVIEKLKLMTGTTTDDISRREAPHAMG